MLLTSFLGTTLAAQSASAAVAWRDIQFGGFLSQGYLKSTNNNHPVDPKDGTFDFREYPLNVSTNHDSHLRVGAQVFGQTLGKYGDDKPILDWLVIDYNVSLEFGVHARLLQQIEQRLSGPGRDRVRYFPH